jgi:hypothetical protein
MNTEKLTILTRRISRFFLFILLFYSCNTSPSSKSIVFEKKFEWIFFSNGELCTGPGYFQVYTYHSSHYGKYAVAEGDSVREMETGTIDSVQFVQTKKSLHCIAGNMDEGYQYDSTYPDNLYLPKSNEIYKYKTGKGINIYLTRDTTAFLYNLIAVSQTDTIIHEVGVMSKGDMAADYFLHDISKDSTPEVFVIIHAVIGPNELPRLEVYSVKDTPMHIGK